MRRLPISGRPSMESLLARLRAPVRLRGEGVVLGAVLLLWLTSCAGAPPSHDTAELDAIRGALAAGRFTEAAERLNDLDDDGATAQLLRGQLFLAREDWFKAEMMFYKARSRSPSKADEFEALVGLGEAALGSGNGFGARDRYEEASALARTDADRDAVSVGLGRAALASGDEGKARRLRASLRNDSFRVGRFDAELAAAASGTAVRADPEPFRPNWNPQAAASPRSRQPERAKAPVRSSAAPEIVRRATWGARPAKRSELDAMAPVTRITVHHTGEAGFSAPRTYAESISRMRSIQGGHQSRWADIGYHWVIDPKGRVFEGRDERWQGAHAGNGAANRANIGIALMGNFDNERPTPEQVDALERTLRWVMTRYGVDPHAIHGHDYVKREHGLGGTSCPGHHLEPILERMKRQLAGAVAARR